VNEREAIVRALEAIEDGDVPGAVVVLLEGLEGDAPTWLPYRCGTCGRRFRWHGELDGHVRRYANRELLEEAA
jgi:hypothetical protein